MKLKPLPEPRYTDQSSRNLVHFTGRYRQGLAKSACDDPGIVQVDAPTRLRMILATRTVRAFPVFGIEGRAVCLSECTQGHSEMMIADGTYHPWAIGLDRNAVFKQGGGPVLEVRGDEWPEVANWPPNMRARAVRLWPGAESEEIEGNADALPWYLSRPSLWSHEREWRVPNADLIIDPADVQFVIVPSGDEYFDLLRELKKTESEMATHLFALLFFQWEENHLKPYRFVSPTTL